MNYPKIKTCLTRAIVRINAPRKGYKSAWSYIKNYCDNNNLNIEERTYIYKTIEKYQKKQEKIIA